VKALGASDFDPELGSNHLIRSFVTLVPARGRTSEPCVPCLAFCSSKPFRAVTRRRRAVTRLRLEATDSWRPRSSRTSATARTSVKWIRRRDPNLIDIQKSSYDKFLQSDISPRERREIGLESVFRSVFPIKDFDGTSELVYVSYNLEKPKYDVDECRQRGMTTPLRSRSRPSSCLRHPRGWRAHRARHQGARVYFGEIPLMTETARSSSTDRARRRLPAPPEPGRLLRPRQGQDPLERQAALFARVIPYSARGSTSNSTTKTSSTAHRPAPEDARHGAAPRSRLQHADLLNYFYSTEAVYLEKAASSPRASSTTFCRASAPPATSRWQRVVVRKNTSSPAPPSRS